jgi:hypothetical protein
MGDRHAELRDVITAGYEASRGIFERLTDAHLDLRMDNGWSVAQMAGHIASAPRADIYVTRRLSEGKNATLPAFLAFAIDITNYFGVRRYRKARKGDLLLELESQHNQLFSFLNDLSEEALYRGGTVFRRGRMTAYEYLRQSPAHAREHGESIESVIGG